MKLLLLHISDVHDSWDEATDQKESVATSPEAVAVDTLAVDGAAIVKDCDVDVNPGGKFFLVRLSSSHVPISLLIGKSQE